MSTGNIIMIKKKKGGHHGGAWKVAFADFMTAMMAFFLVMWLIGQNSSAKEAIAACSLAFSAASACFVVCFRSLRADFP